MTGAQIAAVPAGLVAADRWIVWRSEVVRGRRTKVPYRSDGRGKASSTDPRTWSTFAAALELIMEQSYDGVGIVLGDGLAGCDLDGCVHPITGVIHPAALEIIDALDSYAEISPSGTGVKVFLRGELPPGRRETGAVPWRGYLTGVVPAEDAKYEIAVFSERRYFTVTGMHLDHTPADV
jgi:putative DNA primase/helicase